MKILRFVLPEESTIRVGQLLDETILEYPLGTDLLDVLQSKKEPPRKCPEHRLSDVGLVMPFAPKTIYGIGLNYPSHPLKEAFGQIEKPAVPVIFLKGACAAAGPFDEIARPSVSQALDYEGELAVVIGRSGKPAGYCTADDLTLRDLQKAEKQWTRAKGFDASCPFGPWITSADEVENPAELCLRTWVNGCLRQEANTGDMLFSIDEVIEIISQTNTLQCGDLILTGSPAGTGISQNPAVFLKPGDTVRIEISKLGSIENRIVEK